MSPLLVLCLRRTSVSGVIYVRPQAPRTGRQCRQATTGAREEPQAATPDDRRQQPPRLLGTAARARVAHNRQSKPASTRISVSAALMPRQKRPRTCPADPPVQALLIVCLKQREAGREGERRRERERERESVCVCLVTACACVTCPVARGTHNHVLTQAERAVMHPAAASGTRGTPRTQPRQDTMVLPGGVWSEREDSKAAVTWTSLRSSFPCLQVRMSVRC